MTSGTTSRKRRNSAGGHLHKRLNGRYVKASSPVVAKFWLSYMVHGKRHLVSLDTFDLDEAKDRAAALLAGKREKSSNEAFLRNLIRQGEWAREQLGMGSPMAGDTAKIAAAWEVYLLSRRRPKSGPRTLEEYAARWGRFAAWCAAAGIDSLRSVTPQIAEDYVRDLETPEIRKVSRGKHRKTGRVVSRSGDTVNTHLQCLRLVYRVLDPSWPNPFAHLASALETVSTPYRRLSIEEVSRLVAEAEGEYRLLILIGYTTGLRLIDCATLRWDAVDLSGRVISLAPRKTARRKAGRGVVSPPILPQLAGELAKVAAPGRRGYVLKTIGPIYEERNRRPAVNRAIAALFAAADVRSDHRGHASFHSLRVTWQTLNDEAGTHRAVTRSVLGHTSPALSDTYSRLSVESARAAVEAAIPPV